MKGTNRMLLFIIVYSIVLMFNAVLVIFSPHQFVRVVSLFGVVIASLTIGAFTREFFILKGARKGINK
ncbi:hypothetical protein BC6307_06730 [Sutcliffiella cohnii]|uniref:Uncharacterized protein n=1 Tax=Sutcliffiella cohnii TaxID=33932 RepID=A0A223KNA9_9BACI|nr:hypothetical protein [Sutcliffiella cohnii]AST90995.1 hypothetical protein BC6307_06730 [Sutcliffiella cohnii]